MVLCQLLGVEILGFVEVSAKFNQNIDELLETVLLVAEIQELKADQLFVLSVQLSKPVWIKKRCGCSSSCQQGTLNVQDQSLSEVPSDVSVLWPMTWVVCQSGRSHLPVSGSQWETPMANCRLWRRWKAARARWNVLDVVPYKRQLLNVLVWKICLIPSKLVKWSVNVIIKADVQGSLAKPAASLPEGEVEAR